MKNKKNLFISKKKQRGGIFLVVFGALAIIATIGYIGTTVYTSVVGGMQKTTLVVQSSSSLTQAAYTLTTEVGRDASGNPVPLSYTTGTINPVGGGVIPNNSAAPKTDSFSNSIGYCTGSGTSPSSPVFAIISAGTNKAFDTTCNQALAGTSFGDDKVIVRTVSNILQGVGGTVYYGDPVANISDLGNLAAVRPGHIRLVLSEGSLWTNITGLSGLSNWTRVISDGEQPNGNYTLIIANQGDPCTAKTTTVDGQAYATEGIATVADRSTILTCQGGSWQLLAGPGSATY